MDSPGMDPEFMAIQKAKTMMFVVKNPKDPAMRVMSSAIRSVNLRFFCSLASKEWTGGISRRLYQMDQAGSKGIGRGAFGTHDDNFGVYFDVGSFGLPAGRQDLPSVFGGGSEFYGQGLVFVIGYSELGSRNFSDVCEDGAAFVRPGSGNDQEAFGGQFAFGVGVTHCQNGSAFFEVCNGAVLTTG